MGRVEIPTLDQPRFKDTTDRESDSVGSDCYLGSNQPSTIPLIDNQMMVGQY